MTNSRYEIPAVSFETIREDENWGIRTGSYRSVGANHNAFTQECFLDEIATRHEAATPTSCGASC